MGPHLVRRAAILALAFTAFWSTVDLAETISANGFEPVSLLFTGLTAVVLFPILFLILLAWDWLRAQWGGYLRMGTSLEPAAQETFRYVGRPWRKPLVASLVIVGLAAIVWVLPPPGNALDKALAEVTRWLSLALVVSLVPAFALGFRELTYEVDALGIRMRGRRWPFGLSWDAVARIEASRVLPAFLSPDQGALPRFFALWRADGTVAGTLAPSVELGPKLGRACERTLLLQAARRGLAVVQVPWNGTRRWSKMRRRAAAR